MKAYNFEVYTCHPTTGESGWEIEFPDVVAVSKKEARLLLKRWPLFDCIILFNHETETEKGKGIYIRNKKIKMNLTDQEVFDRMQSTIDKMLEMYKANESHKFNFADIVHEDEIKSETEFCGTVCCVAGWYPVWFPESGVKYIIRNVQKFDEPAPTKHVSLDIFSIDRILRGYHGINNIILETLFYPNDTNTLCERYFDSMDGSIDNDKYKLLSQILGQPKEHSLINITLHWQKVLYAMKTGKIEWKN